MTTKNRPPRKRIPQQEPDVGQRRALARRQIAAEERHGVIYFRDTTTGQLYRAHPITG